MEEKSFSRRFFIKTGATAGLGIASLGLLASCSSKEENNTNAPNDAQAIESEKKQEVAEERTTDLIFITDRLVCKPGDGEELYQYYIDNYVVGAEARGMTLVESSVYPPIWLTDDISSNELTFKWSIEGMMGWAAMVGISRFDPVVAPALIDFWSEIDKRVLSRERKLSSPESEMESLTTLAKLGA